jgi:predicted phage terminase large subunit-like protein
LCERFLYVIDFSAGDGALLGGQIDFGIESTVTSLPQYRAGSIKAFAVMGKTRVMSAMEIPTVDEAGLPGLHIQVWWALFAPKGTSKDIVSKLNAEVRVLLADSTTRQRFAELGQDIPAPDQQSPEALVWAEEHGQIISGVGPFLERRAIERHAYTHREQFPSRGDKAVRAQSMRGRMAMLGLYVRQSAPWFPDLRAELLSFPAGKHDDTIEVMAWDWAICRNLRRAVLDYRKA